MLPQTIAEQLYAAGRPLLCVTASREALLPAALLGPKHRLARRRETALREGGSG